jgi:type I restriction enzyme S subunit
MSAARLLANYERIADATDAIARLRRFIFDLAVRGKLVPQDPNDEPASEFLKRITAERTGVTEAGQFKKQAHQHVTDDSPPFEVPASWAWARLGDVCQYGSSRKVDSNKEISSDTWVLDLEDIERDTSKLIERVPSSARPFRSAKSIFLRGDVLFGKLRPYLNKVLVADQDGVCTSEIIPIRGYGSIVPEYVRLVLKSPLTMARVDRLMYGMKMPRLGTGDAVKLGFPLPPIGEQKRIVEKVDELMALCDRLEAARSGRETIRDRLTAASLARLNAPDPETFQNDVGFVIRALPVLSTRLDQIKQIRQTILNLAVRGKLVPQDLKDEPASELLKRIAKAKAERKQSTGDARIKLEPDPGPDALPMTLPPGWAPQSFENLFLFIDYRGNTPPKTENGIPLITAKNIRMGYLNPEPREYISKATFRTWMTRGFPEIGDLFFTTEAPLANICLNNIQEPFALAQRAICFHPYATIDTKFLMFALMSDVMQTLIDAHATGMTAKGIKAAKLKRLAIPIPPLAEQSRIVVKVDELMTLCDRLEASLTAGENAGRCLLDALIAEALA